MRVEHENRSQASDRTEHCAPSADDGAAAGSGLTPGVGQQRHRLSKPGEPTGEGLGVAPLGNEDERVTGHDSQHFENDRQARLKWSEAEHCERFVERAPHGEVGRARRIRRDSSGRRPRRRRDLANQSRRRGGTQHGPEGARVTPRRIAAEVDDRFLGPDRDHPLELSKPGASLTRADLEHPTSDAARAERHRDERPGTHRAVELGRYGVGEGSLDARDLREDLCDPRGPSGDGQFRIERRANAASRTASATEDFAARPISRRPPSRSRMVTAFVS